MYYRNYQTDPDFGDPVACSSATPFTAVVNDTTTSVFKVGDDELYVSHGKPSGHASQIANHKS